MYGVFMECLVALKQFFGVYGDPAGDFKAYLYMTLFFASVIYIIIRERDIARKLVFGIMPMVVILGFLFPMTRRIYVYRIDPPSGVTYYRILWMIPIYAVMGYAACLIISRIKKDRVKMAVMIAMVIAVALTGKFVYSNAYMKKAENIYHIPQNVIDICDVIAPKDGEPRVRAAFPSELCYFVRQYDTDIMMPFGRQYVEEQWNYSHPVYDAMEKPEVIDAQALLKATREDPDHSCRYIILKENRKIDKDLTTLGLKLVDTIDGYNIYEDLEVK